jgi:hypothetical protein
MKRMIVVFAIAALATACFAQPSKGKSSTNAPATKAATSATTTPVKHAVELESLPGPVRDSITKAIGAGKITKLMSVTTNGVVSYSATVTTGKKKSTMLFDANGNPLAK